MAVNTLQFSHDRADVQSALGHDKPGQLFEVLKLMRDFDANVVSVATSVHEDPDKKILILRFESKNYKVLKSAIKKAGYEMLSAD